jgi:tetratricopeptide (TPR) repeat protein
MRKFKSGLLTFICVLAASAFYTAPVLAQSDGCGVLREVKPTPLTEQTWKRMNDIYEDVGEENYDLAYDKLIAMTERTRGSEYLQAIIQQILGQVEWARENYDAALKAFEAAVDINALPDVPHYALMYQISQLYYMKDRFDDALRSLNLWMCKAPPETVKASAYILKASLYAAKEDWKNVIPPVDIAIGMEDDPQESWYLLKLASHHELEDKPAARDTLKIIIAKWPDKKVYWVQLSNVYFQLEDDAEALAIVALAHRKGLLDKQTDYLYLSNMYALRDVPFKAAEILQEGIDKGIVEATEKHLKMMADAWFFAEELENALVGYEKAGEAAEDGDIDLRRGYILIDLERWEEAGVALSKAIEKGGIDDRKMGEAWVMIGMAEFSLENYEEALDAWRQANRYETARSAATQWMNHLREERARKAP